MCKEDNFLEVWTDPHEGKTADRERFMGFLDENERNGFWVLVKRVVGEEVKKILAIGKCFESGVAEEKDMFISLVPSDLERPGEK